LFLPVFVRCPVKNQSENQAEDACGHQFADMNKDIACQEKVDAHQADADAAEDHGKAFSGKNVLHNGFQ